MKATVAYILKELSVPPHLTGFDYLIDAIVLCYKDREIMHSMTKALYPTIGKMYKKTSSEVERAIRHAVIWCFNNCDGDVTYSVFGNTIDMNTGKVTNSHFIATIVEILRYEPNHPILNGSPYKRGTA